MSRRIEKMDPEAKKRWLEALRSGEFPQGKGGLARTYDGGKTISEFCCLGVLAHSQTPESWEKGPSPEIGRSGVVGFWAGAQMCVGTLPDGFCGLSNSAQVELARLNDSGRYSFEEIADWIEENL